jgi:hypothetical protein
MSTIISQLPCAVMTQTFELSEATFNNDQSKVQTLLQTYTFDDFDILERSREAYLKNNHQLVQVLCQANQ